MADWVKIALKTGLCITVIALIITLFVNIQVPEVNIVEFSKGVGSAKAILSYYLGSYYDEVLTISGVIFALDFGIMTFKLGSLVSRVLIKINE